MVHHVTTLTAIALVALGVGQANAAPILDFVGGSALTSGKNQTAGWAFNLTSATQVDGLGFWDEGADGLAAPHDVGLWSWDGTTAVLLASTTIDNGATPVASTSPDGRWLFSAISPLTLSAGGYLLGATFLLDDPDQARTEATITTAPSLTYLGSRATLELGSPILAPPTLPSAPGDGHFGPNLRLIAVPEPSSLALLGAGIMAVLATRRQKTQASS